MEEAYLCWAQSYVHQVTLSRSLPHCVLSCKTLERILSTSDSENVRFLELKLAEMQIWMLRAVSL